MRYIKYISVFLCMLIFITACTKEERREKIYLEDAKFYMLEKDWRAAISQLQNFIAIENEASVEDRAEAWFLMSDVRLALNQLKESYEVLEYMLDEPDYDIAVRREIYRRLINLYDRANLYSKAAQTRIKYALQGKMLAEETADLLIEAAKSYQAISRYEDSLLVLDDARMYVVNTPLEAHMYYYRAYAQNVLEQENLALESLKKSLEILDSNTYENVDKHKNDLKGLACYLMADILETQEDIEGAYEYFCIALKYYPNRVFIQKRIDLLEEKYKEEIKNKNI